MASRPRLPKIHDAPDLVCIKHFQEIGPADAPTVAQVQMRNKKVRVFECPVTAATIDACGRKADTEAEINNLCCALGCSIRLQDLGT